jgi:hypothetical protein
MAEIPILASKIITTGLTMASTPAVKGVLSAGSGLYSGKKVYDAYKNRTKKEIEKKKSADRDRFIEILMCEKVYYEQCNKLKEKLDALEELHNKFVEKRIFKSWKIETKKQKNNKAATMIQKIVRGYQQPKFRDLLVDLLEILDDINKNWKATMIQKIYRGYRKRIKYPGYPHTRRAVAIYNFTQFDLECARILYCDSDSDDD